VVVVQAYRNLRVCRQYCPVKLYSEMDMTADTTIGYSTLMTQHVDVGAQRNYYWRTNAADVK